MVMMQKKKKKKGLPKIFISKILVYLELCKVSSRLLHAVAVTFIFLFDKYQKKRCLLCLVAVLKVYVQSNHS